MEGATHFIEAWRTHISRGGQDASSILPIEDLEIQMNFNEIWGTVTLFIWKIKLKSLTTNTK